MLPLVEVVRQQKTTDKTVSRTLALLETLHRQVVVLNRSVPGMLVNRFAQALFRESIYLIEQGVTTAADIDKAVKYAMGMRYASIGLLEYFDAVGYDLESTIAKNVYPDLCDTKEIQELVKAGLASGKTGQAAKERRRFPPPQAKPLLRRGERVDHAYLNPTPFFFLFAAPPGRIQKLYYQIVQIRP